MTLLPLESTCAVWTRRRRGQGDIWFGLVDATSSVMAIRSLGLAAATLLVFLIVTWCDMENNKITKSANQRIRFYARIVDVQEPPGPALRRCYGFLLNAIAKSWPISVSRSDRGEDRFGESPDAQQFQTFARPN